MYISDTLKRGRRLFLCQNDAFDPMNQPEKIQNHHTTTFQTGESLLIQITEPLQSFSRWIWIQV